MSEQLVIETPTGWMIRCDAHGANGSGWHEFPKKGRPGATWTFNGDLLKPTFQPSMNEGVNQPGPNQNPEVPASRCHFIVRDGIINYCDDCTHGTRGAHVMLPWSDSQIRYYDAIMTQHRNKEASDGVSS